MASFLNRPIQLVLFSVLSIGLFCIGEINADWNAEAVLGGRGGDLKQREFDYFKLSLQWPGTVCRHTKHCCSSNGCCRGSNAPVEFTIHGLWPDYNDGTWPSCCSGHRFNVKEISTLLDALNKYWPSFSCSSVSDCHGGKGLFWGHEWEKHGTCSSSVTNDEYNYFLTALNLYFKYNVTVAKITASKEKYLVERTKEDTFKCDLLRKLAGRVGGIFLLNEQYEEVLREEGYVASNTEKYPVGGIISAIQNAFHATPELQCKSGAVEELRLCFYKDFKPRDCADDSKRQSDMVYSKASCPKHVSLPAYVSSRLENSGTEVSSSTLKSSF